MPMVGGWKHHVTDIGGKYYHVTDCGEKKYIGCHFPAEEGEKCLAAMERLAKHAREIRNMAESEKNEKKAAASGKVRRGCSVPFRDEMGAESR